MPDKKIPFTLESLQSETHFIETPEEWFRLMVGSNAAEKLYDRLQEQDGRWGLKLPKKYGLSVGERTMVRDAAASRNEAILKYSRLLAKISSETEKPIEQLQEMMSDPFAHLAVLNPYMAEVTQVLTALGSTDLDNSSVTIVLQQRAIASWTNEDTQSLHEELYAAVLEYIAGERSGWKTEDEAEMGNPTPAEELETKAA